MYGDGSIAHRELSTARAAWESLLTSYPPSEVEVFERKEAEGDGRPAGGRAGRRATGRITASWLPPFVISIWCVRGKTPTTIACDSWKAPRSARLILAV